MTTTGALQRLSEEAPRTRRWAAGAVGTSLVVLIGALLFGGGVASAVPGLSDPGVLTRWGLPVSRAVLDGLGAVTAGLLVLAVMLPAPRGKLADDARRATRAAAITAVAWAAAAAVVFVFTLSDIVGEPIWDALSAGTIVTFASAIPQGQAYAAVFVLALGLAPAARLAVGRGGTLAALLLAIGTLVPPTLAGHSATGDYHHSAVASLLVHVVAMSLWVGGLAAVGWYAGWGGAALARVARTFSALALGCFVMVGGSGVLNAWLRLDSPADLVTSPYGLLILAKVTALATLGWFGVTHRRTSLRRLYAGEQRVFRRLAAGEVVVMAAALALGVALSRTAPPVPDDSSQPSVVRDLLGFPIPPDPTPLRLVTEAFPDAVFALGCLGAALLYLGGVWRLRRRGDRWPAGRVIAWLLGVGSIAAVQMSGLMTYGMTLLSVHMVQHIVLMLVSPVLLVLGGPITLALRALRPAPAGERGPREWLAAATQSRPLRLVTHPLVALAIFVSGPFATYFTGLFEYAMRNHAVHWMLSAHFILAGYVFYEIIIGIDPLPKRPPYAARLGMQFAAMAIHAFFGIALMESARLIAGDYYRQLATETPWLSDSLDDQILAGQLTWGSGEIPGLLVLGALFVQWYRSDAREARRFDRREGDVEAERLAYNAYLARLDEQARGVGYTRRAPRGQVAQSEERPPEKREAGGSKPPLSTS